MLMRIAGIIFPIFIIVLIGYFYGRRFRPDMHAANTLNMDVFLPALIFTALAGKSFHLAENLPLAIASLVVMIGCGLLCWPVACLFGYAPKTLVPPMMFKNAGNMGLPLIVLAFGEKALSAAVVLMLVETLFQFALSPWLLARKLRLNTLWREPVFGAALAGLAVAHTGVTVWPPLMAAGKLLGDISIGLMIFSLGIRLSGATIKAWGIGIVGAISTAVAGMAVAWVYGPVSGLGATEQDILVVFGALPPAVVNFIFAERYRQEPEKVASIVMIGNASAILFVSLALALRPGPL